MRSKTKTRLKDEGGDSSIPDFPNIDEKIPTFIINMKGRDEPHKLIFIGDLHYGSRASCKEFICECIDKVKEICQNSSASVFLMGDILESFALRDATACVEEVAQLFRPIAPYIRYIIEGNHEDKLRRMNDISPTMCLLHELRKYNPNIKGGLYSTYIAFYFRRRTGKNWQVGKTVLLYLTHGYGGGKTEGTALNRIAELAHIHNADIIVSGHHHQLNWSVGAKFTIGKRGRNLKLYASPQYRLLTPSFFQTYAPGVDTYSSKRGYRPTVMGVVGIELYPLKGTHRINPTITAQEFTIAIR